MSFNPCPKDICFRSPAIKALANECPRCMACGKVNQDDVVAAHSNCGRHGKGMGQKASDLVAYLCRDCHDRYDDRAKPTMLQDEFHEAVFASILWLLKEGHLVVKK